ncbi:MAG: tannase/feruloyl esterase family alpha/beta hydrolase [Acidobacteriota bacterium]
MKRTYLTRLASFLLASLPLAAATCESLNSLQLPNTSITAVAVAAGAYAPAAPAAGKGKASTENYADLPGFCDVKVISKPTPDSVINMEYWLPATNWNGNLLAAGNGGFGSAIGGAGGSDPRRGAPMVAALRGGYVAAMTDTGHDGAGGTFALGHPEKVIDFGYRAVHELADIAKKLIQARYETPVRKSYFDGCSGGGRQALKAAQMYPSDFDGVVAGSPAVASVGRAAQALWIGQQTHKDADSALPQAKFAVVHEAVLAACDALDGVKDGVLENPRKCNFDPKTITCAGADTPTCLTAAQADTVRKIYADVKNPRTGEVYFPGHEPGSENGWTTMAGANPFGVGVDMFRYVVFNDATWDYKTLNFDADMTKAMKAGAAIDALDPNLKPFFDRGGKIIQYHGWNDPQISPRSSVTYYESVVKANGGLSKVQQNHMLYMVPGMNHCSGGDGTATYDMFTALTQWVEQNKTPGRIEATRVRAGVTDRARPLCAYPATAQYKGTGSTDESVNFVCK